MSSVNEGNAKRQVLNEMKVILSEKLIDLEQVHGTHRDNHYWRDYGHNIGIKKSVDSVSVKIRNVL